MSEGTPKPRACSMTVFNLAFAARSIPPFALQSTAICDAVEPVLVHHTKAVKCPEQSNASAAIPAALRMVLTVNESLLVKQLM